ncbi:type II toxin-antitoxin system HicA family toxin [Minwuia sp.]|uniref:type II toxin-antitoxin system HicA family toxin n=1 Tax=Minwuia sp. TaxID=2493630 RepID=UPI003A8DD228
MPERDSRRIIRRLLTEGWQEVSRKGSHRTFKHPKEPKLVTLPHPRKDLKTGTARSIARMAGWL